MPRSAPGHRALRAGRISLPGQVYLTTTVCVDRIRLFADFEAACAAARVLGSPEAWYDAEVFAWVLMPDHLHALVQLGELPLHRVMQSVHSRAAIASNRAMKRTGAVWQGAFHEHALREDESCLAAARYLIANPLRAGLVTRVGDYPFWDAAWAPDTADPMDLLL
ncbi:MAG: REP-associated tyrosine transposase [Arenimonas sp.]